MSSAIRRHWFLVFLAFSFSIGYYLSNFFAVILEWSLVRDTIVFAVMWAMGVTLPAGQIRQSLRCPKPSLLAIIVNVIAVPVLVLPTCYVLTDELFGGLFVTAIVPSTLASASVWTRRAGGDDSISMMTTVVTNLGCVVVVPIGIWLVLEQQVQMDPWLQVSKLSWLVAFPLALAQGMRYFGASSWADRNKAKLGFATQVGILTMVFWGAISSGGTSESETEGVGGGETLVVVFGCALLVHWLSLRLAVLLARRIGLSPSQQIAIGFAGSQKTLMVGLQIAIDCGVSVLPMIIYHLGQLLVDTVIADRWKLKVEDMQYSDPP